MWVACHFHCGESAAVSNWNGADGNGGEPGFHNVTIYVCPSCGIYGVSGRVEACFLSRDKWEQQIEKQFLLMRKDLQKRRATEAPLGSDKVGVFTMMENDAALQLVFLQAKTAQEKGTP